MPRLAKYRDNFRTRRVPDCVKRPQPARGSWCEYHWKQIERTWPAFNDVADSAPDKLSIISMCLESDNTAVVLCNPALVKATVAKLANKAYIKLCGDGTHRLLNGQWILTSVGVISKHYSRGEKDKMHSLRSTLHPLVFAIVNKESEQTYRALFQGVKHAVRKLTGEDWGMATKQYHCDWHAGEEKARRAEFPMSVRCGDWAHFVGATTRPKMPAPVGSHSEAHHRMEIRCLEYCQAEVEATGCAPAHPILDTFSAHRTDSLALPHHFPITSSTCWML